MKVGYVALVGRPNVGKSTLLNFMLGEKVAIISDKPQTTRTNILGIKTTPKGQIIFVDNPGIHKPLHKLNMRMMSFVYSAFETADLVALLIDSTQKYGHGDEFVIETLKKISTVNWKKLLRRLGKASVFSPIPAFMKTGKACTGSTHMNPLKPVCQWKN